MIEINSVNYFPINRFNDLFSEAKDKGDECFSIKDYSKAIEYYNECMKYVSNDVERYTIQKSIGRSYFLLVYIYIYIIKINDNNNIL